MSRERVIYEWVNEPLISRAPLVLFAFMSGWRNIMRENYEAFFLLRGANKAGSDLKNLTVKKQARRLMIGI